MEKTGETQVGKAYAFFDIEASKDELARALPEIKARQGFSNLELSLQTVEEFVHNTQTDPKLVATLGKEIYPTFPAKYKHLMATAKPVPMRRLQYAVEASGKGVWNEGVANALGDVINDTYLQFGRGEPFVGAIMAEIDGEYLFKD